MHGYAYRYRPRLKILNIVHEAVLRTGVNNCSMKVLSAWLYHEQCAVQGASPFDKLILTRRGGSARCFHTNEGIMEIFSWPKRTLYLHLHGKYGVPVPILKPTIEELKLRHYACHLWLTRLESAHTPTDLPRTRLTSYHLTNKREYSNLRAL